MAQLYLTRKRIQNQQLEALSVSLASNNRMPATPNLRRLSSTRSGGSVSNYLYDNDVEDLEMLLEAYFMQLDGIRNKIISVSIFSYVIPWPCLYLFFLMYFVYWFFFSDFDTAQSHDCCEFTSVLVLMMLWVFGWHIFPLLSLVFLFFQKRWCCCLTGAAWYMFILGMMVIFFSELDLWYHSKHDYYEFTYL